MNALEPLRDPETASCPVHHQPAIGPCSRCGTFMCQRCASGLCPACVARAGELAPYFAVSIPKLILMSVATLGVYEFYWFYQQWKHEKARTNANVSPFWRAFFSGLCSFGLFRRIKGEAERHGVPAGFNPTVLGGLVVAFNLSWRLPGALWLLSWLSFLPLLPIQSTLNALNEELAPGADKNTRFSGANIAVLLLGAILLGLNVVGLLRPSAQSR